MGSPARDASSSESPLVVFDDLRGTFGPLTDLRAAFELRAGLGTMLERIEARLGRRASSALVDPRLAEVVSERLARPVNQMPVARAVHLVNGCLLDPAHAAIADGEIVATADGTLVAARVPADPAITPAALAARATRVVEAPIVRAPWDLTTAIASTLEADLALFTPSTQRALRPDEGQSFGPHPIAIDPTATIGPLAVIDASKGPVVIGPGVVVRPLSVLVGPCAVLEGSTIAERSLLKASTVIGPHCRAGGEIGGTIFQAYSNKSHDGHLGDSFVGEWSTLAPAPTTRTCSTPTERSSSGSSTTAACSEPAASSGARCSATTSSSRSAPA